MLIDILSEFLMLDSQGGDEIECTIRKVRFLRENTELLTSTAETMIGRIIEMESDKNAKAYLREQRELMQREAKFGLLNIYLQATVEEKKKLLFVYPQLFGEEICEMLEALIRLQDDPQAEASLARELKLLLTVREESKKFPTLSFKHH